MRKVQLFHKRWSDRPTLQSAAHFGGGSTQDAYCVGKKFCPLFLLKPVEQGLLVAGLERDQDCGLHGGSSAATHSLGTSMGLLVLRKDSSEVWCHNQQSRMMHQHALASVCLICMYIYIYVSRWWLYRSLINYTRTYGCVWFLPGQLST